MHCNKKKILGTQSVLKNWHQVPKRSLSFWDGLGPVHIGIDSFHFLMGNSLPLPRQSPAPAVQCRLVPLPTCLRGAGQLAFTQALPREMREIAPTSPLLFPILPPTAPQTHHSPNRPVARYLGGMKRLEGVRRGHIPCATRERVDRQALS